MADDATREEHRREARWEDSRRAGAFAALSMGLGALSRSLNDGGLLFGVALLLFLVGIYYAARSTFRLESEDEPG